MNDGLSFGALVVALFTLVLMLVWIARGAHHDRTGEGSTVAVGKSTNSSRFKVEYQGAFNCDDYDRENMRAMYVITDATTGVSYLAVQGCGTSQLVTETHMIGKTPTTTTVER